MKASILSLLGVMTISAAHAQSTLSTAVDNPDLTWRTGGNVAWFGQTATSHDGMDAARSGRIFEGQQSWLETTVSGPGVVAFWWKTSSEGSADMLEFSIGGRLQATISGESLWKLSSFQVPAGLQILRWRFVKDIGTDLGADSGYVDEVRYSKHEGAPAILVQVPDVKAAVGATIRLKPGVAGAAPLSYQWYFDETNLLSAAGAELVLANVQLAQAGRYHLIVSNSFGVLSSGMTSLSVGTNGPADNILLFVDGPASSPFQTALNTQGRSYQIYNLDAMGAFNAAVEQAHPTNTLVIVSSYNAANDFSEVISFIQKGGRVILQFWYLGVPGIRQNIDLAAAFNARAYQEFSVPPPVYNWGGSTLFTGVTSPISLRDTFNVDGQRLTVLAGGTDVAGYSSSRTANQSGVIIGNSGRTILNGFFLEEASVASVGARFAQNEIEFLVGAPILTPPVISSQPRGQKAVVGGSVTLAAAVGGTPPLSFQWFHNDTQAVAGATAPSLVLNNLNGAHAGSYTLVVQNTQGTVTSSAAVLGVSELGPVSSVLLLVDLEPDNLYREALNSAGVQHEFFSSEASFNQAAAQADAAVTLLIVDAPKYGHDLREVTRFIRAGGKAIIEYWNFANDQSLSAALGISALSPFYSPVPVYSWGGSSLFDQLQTRLNLLETEFSVDGQNLQAIGSAKAVAGYTSAFVSTRAGIVIGLGNRTIANGFGLENISPRAHALQLIKNELVFLGGAPAVAPPFISVQPQNQTVVAGATALFAPVVGGTPPLHYQWYFNGTRALLAGTNSVLQLENAQFAQAGSYSAVISNAVGSVMTIPADLRLTGLGPVTNILIFTDEANGSSPFRTALNNLRLVHTVFTNENVFDSATASAPLESSLAIVDCTIGSTAEFKGVEAFARAGGRVILQFWRLAQRPALAETLGLASLQPISFAPQPVYAWNDSDFFLGLASPLQLASPGYNVEGQTLQPASTAIAVAGFLSAPVSGQAAIVVGNSGRTIVNGFFLKEASPLTAGVRLGQNQIRSLLAIRVAPPVLRLTGLTRSAGEFELAFTAPSGLPYSVFSSTDLWNWQPSGSATEESPGQFRFIDAPTGPAKFYRVRTP